MRKRNEENKKCVSTLEERNQIKKESYEKRKKVMA